MVKPETRLSSAYSKPGELLMTSQSIVVSAKHASVGSCSFVVLPSVQPLSTHAKSPAAKSRRYKRVGQFRPLVPPLCGKNQMPLCVSTVRTSNGFRLFSKDVTHSGSVMFSVDRRRNERKGAHYRHLFLTGN